ncbi:elongation factor P [Candidatus Hydrogenedentota bacterium]
MISTADFKNGMTIILDGKLVDIVEFQHVKPGKGGAFVRTKLKGLETGNVLDKTFRAGEKFERAILDDKKMEYLYSADGLYYFMDNTTFEQEPLSEEQLGDAREYLKENTEITVTTHNGAVVGVALPTFIELEVKETDPGFKGDTATGGNKPAKVETGKTVQVPLFINIGDVIKIDTRTGEYMERVNK